MLRTTSPLWIVLFAMSVATACGSNNDSPNNVMFEPDMGIDLSDSDVANDEVGVDDMNTPDMTMEPDAADMADMPDMMVTDCNGAVCGPGEECINNVCVLTDSCASALDLGLLMPNQPQTVMGSLITEGVEDLVATCVGATSLRDRVITFEVGVEAQVEYSVNWQGQYDGVVELRSDCTDDSTVLDCSDIENRTVNVMPGRYYLVLDQKFGNAGAFEATITVRESQCTPGVRTCMADSLEICPDPQSPMTLPCADGCDTGVCHGDMCTNAIPVTAGATYTGDGRVYKNNLDFGANMNCTDSGDPTNPIATPGFEVVYYLPGLTAGEVVTIDAQTNDTNINAIFIIQMCGDTGTCAAAYKLTEQPDWVVTASGNYYVIIDKRQATNNPFQYSIDVL